MNQALPASPPLLLSVRNLSKFYGPTPGCHEIDFDLFAGEIIGFAGESGSGRSTLLRCLGGQLRPTNGSVHFHSSRGLIDLWQADEPVLRSIIRTEIGLMPGILANTCEMAVSAGGTIGKTLMANGLRHFSQLRKIIRDWFEILEIDPGRMDEPLSAFSEEIRQRIRIAAVLAPGPRILLIDEPGTGLDLPARSGFILLLRRLVLRFSLTVILATGDPVLAGRMCHRLHILKDGRLEESGLSDQILADPRSDYTRMFVSSVWTT